jgi:phytoene dehydrogenase-like protein
VANADAAHLYSDLLPHRIGGAARRRLQRTEPSLSGFVLLLGVTGTPPPAHHTVLFGRSYDAEFDAIFGRHPRPVADPTLYVAAAADPAVAPAGAQSWFVLANAPRHGPVDWRDPTVVEAYAAHLLDVLRARGMDVTGRVSHRVVRTPFDLQQRTRASGGAIYGTSSNGARSAFLRPANRGPAQGLFLVGGSSHPGGGLPLVLLSAEITAGLVGRAG